MSNIHCSCCSEISVALICVDSARAGLTD